MRALKRLVMFVLIIFILPALATLGWWSLVDRPSSYRSADWSSAGILPPAHTTPEAAVYLFAARTGGLKGAFSVHSWIVLKRAGAANYERYDKVGWGSPVRHNAYVADSRWYSNTPEIIHAVRGAAAEALIPQFEAAIAAYPFSKRGGYRIWPGPNSNSFVAHLLRAVPAFGGRMPPNATGRDYAPGVASLDWSPEGLDLHFTLGGFVGFAAGWSSGLEIHLAGLVAGIDLARPALKIPALGRVGFSESPL